jgi:NADP-dependent 3-hydroxy acid dehydrogenase YdfG
VSSEVKRQYLMDNYGIDSGHIFNSRDSSFLPGVMGATNQRGVDVVLNSLSGDLLHASWKCVAEFGTMVEIGKRDFQRRAKLAMETFEENRTFVGLELRKLYQSRPQKANELLERCAEWIRSGAIRGPAISSIFPATQIQEACRAMQTAKHIGKMVIEMPKDTDELLGGQEHEAASKPTPVFRSDRTYLLTGGLGGLGRAIAVWMVEHGARHLVFLSRSAREGSGIDGFLNDLRSQDCQVQLVAGSVGNMADVQRAVDAANAIKPIAGVINLSMVLKDIALSDMTFEDWMTAVEPKVNGTWNLHNATTSSTLDFFLLFSSYSSMIGQWGQANYSAANTFLDAFVQYRHQNGLAASVIDIGVMGDVGFVAENAEVLHRLERTGMRILREQDLLDAMVLALERSDPAQASGAAIYKSPGQVLLGLNTTIPISSPYSRVAWKRDARMSIYHNLERASAEASSKSKNKGGTSLRTLLADAGFSNEENTAIIAKALAGALANFLIKNEDTIALDRPLETLGMDSLVAMEMRNWIRQQVGVEMSTFTIVQSPSFVHLGEQVRQAMAGDV